MRRVLIVSVAAMLLAIWSACASDGGPTGSGDCTLDGIDFYAVLTPLLPTIFVRESVAVSVEEIIEAGSDCTAGQLEELELTSDAPEIASVGTSGVTGVSPGIARLRVTLPTSADSFDIEVVPTPATSLVVVPSTRLLGVDQTFQFAHACRDAEGFDTVCPLGTVIWSKVPASSPVASVNGTGLVRGDQDGEVDIRAALGSLSGTATVTVEGDPAPAASVVVTPASRQMAISSTYQFEAVCRDAGGFDTVCPEAATWSTNPPSSPVASVSGSGVVRANQEGSVDITATVGSLVGTAAVTVTTSSLIFQMDLSAGAFPLAGFDELRDTSRNQYSVIRRPDAGPGGIPSYQLVHNGSTNGSGNLQPYMGWYVDLGANHAYPLTYGDNVFVRFYFRFVPGTRCESWNNGVRTNTHETKFHIISDYSPGGNSTGRTMIGVVCNANSGNPDPAIDSVTFDVRRANGDQRCNANGVVGGRNGYTHVNDTTWVAVQYRLTYSSSQNAADASYALWVDNTNEANPNCEINTDTWSGSVVVNAVPDYDLFQWGFYWNTIPDLTQGGVMGYELTGYEVGRTFDPTWGN